MKKIQASRNNAISLQVAIEEYFRDNNLDEEIVDYDFGNGAFTEWHFYCDGDDFKYIDDNNLYDYIADLREFRNENFEVFSFRDEISIKILDDEYEESKKSATKSIEESADDNWYKLKMLNEMLDAMEEDEYNIPKLGIYGVTKNINLDEGAIRALIKYYK